MGLAAQATRARPALTDSDPLFGLPGPVGRIREHERLEAILAVRPRLVSGLHRADERVELVAIGALIALEEEVERLVAGEAVRAGPFDGGLAHIRRRQHAVRAMRLDPLVVAVSRTARIGDLRHFA